MKVDITYCTSCGYRRQATQLVDAIWTAHGSAVRTEMRLATGGVFDISIDGVPVFRKWEANRFPSSGEILAEIDRRLEKV